jgi:hypothetical protein
MNSHMVNFIGNIHVVKKYKLRSAQSEDDPLM